MKRILDVGQCSPDHASIRAFVTKHFDCEVVQAHGLDDTCAELERRRFDLVLINRKLDHDYSDGIDILRQLNADSATSSVPVRLVTNYPEHQDEAVAAGAVRGFGKLEFEEPATLDKLRAVLDQ